MRHHYSFFIFIIVLIACSRSEGDVQLTYEPGIYKPYGQELSSVFAFTGNKEIDGSSIIVTGPSGKTGDIHFVEMEPRVDALREPTIRFNTILLGKRNTARVLCPTCPETSMQLKIKNDSIFLIPENLKDAVKFAPYTEMGLTVVSGKEAELHATIRGKMMEEGFILSTYNIFIKSSSVTKGITDANYLDLDYLKKELEKNDTLVYVKKETYFRKP